MSLEAQVNRCRPRPTGCLRYHGPPLSPCSYINLHPFESPSWLSLCIPGKMCPCRRSIDPALWPSDHSTSSSLEIVSLSRAGRALVWTPTDDLHKLSKVKSAKGYYSGPCMSNLNTHRPPPLPHNLQSSYYRSNRYNTWRGQVNKPPVCSGGYCRAFNTIALTFD